MPQIRDLNELHPGFRPLVDKWLAAVAKRKIDVLVIETRRTWEVMEAYYARGRKPLSTVNRFYRKAGLRPITGAENKSTITNARPGQSWHFFGLALDFVPLINGRADWEYTPLSAGDHYDEIAEEALKLGIHWGGQFKSFKDYPHLEHHPGYDDTAVGVAEAMVQYDTLKTWQIPLKP